MAGKHVETAALVERLFQEQSSRLVAHFTRRLGAANLELAEEVVQEALLQALQRWPYGGVPSNPAGWLYRVALNRAVDAVRRRKWIGERAAGVEGELEPRAAGEGVATHPLDDDELRLVLMCCHPLLPAGGRVALSLKTVGGLSASEIGRALLCDTRAVEQRLARARAEIRRRGLTMDLPAGRALAPRLSSALDVCYLLFNEGYSAHAGDDLIRTDLCRQAIRLARLIADAGRVATPESEALVALMSFQAARAPARVDARGELVRLDEQDRAQWDGELLSQAFAYFNRSMRGARETPLHLQAAIAATHAVATTAEATDWSTILELYDALIAIDPSPIARLHRVVAVAKVQGPAAALAAMTPLRRERSLRGVHLLPAITAELHAQRGNRVQARAHYRVALAMKSSTPERRFLQRRLQEME